MFPSYPVSLLKSVQVNNPSFQQHLPYAISQQQRIETHLNLTNASLRQQPLNVFPIIPQYQWKAAPDIPFTSPKGSRKRKNDSSSQYDGKRQCYGSPRPNGQLVKTGSYSPGHQAAQGQIRGSVSETCSLVHSPMCPIVTSTQTGCVPSLGEKSCLDAVLSLPPHIIQDKLSQQILELFHTCEQRREDLERKEFSRAQLQRDIQSIFPCARVYLAGSSLNGFGSRTSDADLCLVIKEGPINQKTDAVYILSLVRTLLYKLSYIERPQLIRAKVPILKFRDRVRDVEFDLNVNNTVGIRNTFLLRTYAYIENRVRPLILVIKKWASHHRINDASRGTLSSYTLVLMVLHYLQTLTEPVIPCLQKDYPECFSPVMDIHLVPDGPKHIPPYMSKNQSSLGDLFLGFLKYYATVFKWGKNLISIREAKALPKPNSWEWKDKFICVEEPFDGTNTARAVHEKMKFDAIKAEFKESWQELLAKKDLNHILPIRETKPKRVKPR
ncbi:poly(A) RNA polymerase GLD2 [Trichomycterus rosablanca]|uniref:poly(A) RNA polymerase GLD2 n=1 Tax=Trichomycterus rosablanca TaxID=2290929 RepID=UPI002F35D7B8